MKNKNIILSLSTLFIFAYTFSYSAPISENWMNVFLMGDKIGYYHETKEETTYQTEKVYDIKSEMVSKLARFGIEFNIRQVSEVYLAKDYSARYCRYSEDMMGSRKEVTATVQGNKLLVEINVGGEITKQTLDWGTSKYFDPAITEKIIHDGLVAGKKYQFTVYSPELARWFDITASVGTTEKLEINGIMKDAVLIRNDYAGAPELSSSTWISKDGQVFKAELGNYGMLMVQVSESDAKEFKQKLEVADLSRIPSNVTFTEPSEVTKTRIKITYTEGDPTKFIPQDVRQKFEESTDSTSNSRVLVITSTPINVDTAPSLPMKLTDEKLTRFLSSSPYIESQDSAIVATAKQVVGFEKNSARAAISLCNWVNSYIENKGFDTGFASAKATFNTRKGDCTEHSVLLAALTRAVGIPTKIATGVTFSEDGFYYHMWCEVYLGQWVPLDATLGETRVDATHIKLAETESKEDELSDYALKLLRSLKKFKLEVVDYDMAGEHYTAESSTNPNDIYKSLEKMLNESN